MNKIRKHLDANLIVSVKGEEDGKMEVEFKIQAKEPYAFIIEGLEFGVQEALKQYKEEIKINKEGCSK